MVWKLFGLKPLKNTKKHYVLEACATPQGPLAELYSILPSQA